MAGRKHLKLKEYDITRLYSEYQIIDKLEVLYPCEKKLYSLINDNNYIYQVGDDDFEIINNGFEILIRDYYDLINKCRYKMNFRTKIYHFINNLNMQKIENLNINEREVLELKKKINYLTKDDYFKFYKLAEILMKDTNNKIKNRQFENVKKIKLVKELTETQIKRKKENHLKFFIGGSFLSFQKILDPDVEKSAIELLAEMITVNFMYNLTLPRNHDLIAQFHLNHELPMFFELHNLINQMLDHPLNKLAKPEKE